jgi:Lar family restriction alleviation protein
MSDAQLKPCPFCGITKIDGGYNDYGGFVSICANCNANGPPASEMSKDAIIAAWNTRPTPTLAEALAVPEVAALIKLMKGALGDIHDGEPEWPDDAAKELEWCRNRALAALDRIKEINNA